MKKSDAAVPVFKSEMARREYLAAYDKSLALWPVPFQERDVPTRFGSSHMIACGPEDAPPLVLFHGAHASSTMWYANIEAFSRGHRTYAVDFILEPGKSVLDRRMSTAQDLAGWIEEILDRLGLEKPDFIGLSRGAWNAVSFAVSRPHRVKKLVLMSPAQTFTPIRNAGFLAASLMASLFPSERRARKVVRIASTDPARIEPFFMNQYTRALSGFNVLSGIQVPPALFTDGELGVISSPVLLLIGDRDVINDGSSVERARNLVRDIETEIVPGAGHLVSLDRPDYVNQRIMSFLSGGAS